MTEVKSAAVELSIDSRRPSSDTAVSRTVSLVLLTWFLAVAAVGHSGLLIGATIRVFGGYIAGTTAILCVLGLFIPALRDWLCSLPIRLLVMMNVLRLVGVAFLVSSDAPGGLPDTFARSAGYGDIFAAITALVLAIGFLPAITPLRRRLLLAWNIIGIADLLVAVGTTVSILNTGSKAMAPLASAPLMYVPFYFVPLLVFVHMIIFYRMATGELASEGMTDLFPRSPA